MDGDWDDAPDEPWEPDWHCTYCGASGRRKDGPAVCDCPDGPPILQSLS